MAEYWEELYPNIKDGSRIHHYKGNCIKLLFRSYIEYEMDLFFSIKNNFAKERLYEIKTKLLNILKINEELLEQRINDFLITYDGLLPPQYNHYGDWIRINNSWQKQTIDELLYIRETGIKYYTKYIEYKKIF